MTSPAWAKAKQSMLVVLLATLGQASAPATQAVPSPQALAASVLPLPGALHADAGVRVVGPTGVTILHPSTNGLMCTADRPGDDVFDAAGSTAAEAIDKWQSVYFPFHTAAELGLLS